MTFPIALGTGIVVGTGCGMIWYGDFVWLYAFLVVVLYCSILVTLQGGACFIPFLTIRNRHSNFKIVPTLLLLLENWWANSITLEGTKKWLWSRTEGEWFPWYSLSLQSWSLCSRVISVACFLSNSVPFCCNLDPWLLVLWRVGLGVISL